MSVECLSQIPLTQKREKKHRRHAPHLRSRKGITWALEEVLGFFKGLVNGK